MPFWGVVSGKVHFAFIVPTDLRGEYCIEAVNRNLAAIAKHDFLRRDGLGIYEVVVVPAMDTPIGSALEYRKWLVERNEFVSLKDKTTKNPNVGKLIGATHAYLWGDGRSAMAIEKYAKAGLDRMWLGFDQIPRVERHLVNEASIAAATKNGYLIGPYDTLDNVQSTRSADAISSVFDDDLHKNGCVIKKDGTKMTGFAGRGCQLSSEALRLAKRPFLKERIEKFKTSGANSYFLDCDAFGDFLDDYDSRHSMTKGKDRLNRSERLRFIADENQLVLGSEGGTAWSTRYVHFLHGANDTFNRVFWPLLKDKKKFGTWWPPEGMGVFFKKVNVDDEFVTAKYSPVYRLPLFQTVFHDSVISTERWELSLSKIPAVAQTRALFWQLYNIAPIWNLNLKEWEKYKSDVVAHHKFFSKVHLAVASHRIVDFSWLTSDKSVQRITFEGGATITGNFSSNGRDFPARCVEYKDGSESMVFCPKNL